ncbi:hypothetical protein ZWY2020_036047 [Hordeum vulgare]|nr:hypothetical protein ZWY2020_036047 [Hordeum vulgare]
MDKLVQFGKKAWFVVRVASGYEERRIRSYRLQLQQRLEQAQAKKKEIEKQPEQVILSEVRQVVQQMQALNQHLEEAETAIDEYFKPIDKNAQVLTDMQMEKEEKQMKEMLQVMRGQIQMQREIEARKAEAIAVEPVDTQASETTSGIPPKQETTAESPNKKPLNRYCLRYFFHKQVITCMDGLFT